jgi:hypothetical protein
MLGNKAKDVNFSRLANAMRPILCLSVLFLEETV